MVLVYLFEEAIINGMLQVKPVDQTSRAHRSLLTVRNPMPMIERTAGCSAAHGFGAAGYPVIGAVDIASPGDIKNGNRSHQVAKRAAPAAVYTP